MRHRTISQPKEKRNKLELYNAVLDAIRNDLIDNKISKPTRVQFLVGTSYDKLAEYLDELEQKNLIKQKPLRITEKGKKFLQEYDRISELTRKFGIKFLKED
ncbi:MAG TPA: winged helix-turn-helix domain-containing protein [Nitrosopumilaceae archaeon]|nr:winged helix-turn-helix domain-containing protein [Nitrosopumilaceae archaeon]